MDIVEETIVKEVKKKWYVAFDGEKFENEYYCLEHEANLKKEGLERRNDIIFYEKLDGYAPFDGKEHYEENSYVWMKPLTIKAIEEIKEAYPYEFVLDNQYLLNKIICIEIGPDDCWWYLLDDSIKYEKKILKILGEQEDEVCG